MKKYKIFINGIAARRGGGVTYLNILLFFLLEREDVDVTIYGFSRINSELRNNKKLKIIDLTFVHRNIFFRILLEKIFFPFVIWLKEFDIAFFPNGMVTGYVPSSTKSITMFQNMLPFSDRDIAKFPIGYDKFRYWFLKQAYLKSYKKADHVIFISEYAQYVITQFVPEIKMRSSVIPHGIPEVFRKQKKVDTSLPMLYVSIYNEYKHQIEIVKGLALYKKKYGTAPRLQLAGFAKKEYLKKLKQVIHDLNLDKHVDILGPILYEDIPDLYQNSGWVIFGSTCENCPTILLEAMGSGSPIICSSYQPMPEFLKDAGVYFDPEKPESFANALEIAISYSQKEVQDIGNKTYNIALKYTCKKNVNETWKVFSGE